MKKVLSAMGILLAAGAARAMIETLPLSRLVEAADVVAVCETVEQTQRSVPADATPAIRHVLKPVEVLQARIEPGTTITLETLGTLDGKTWVEVHGHHSTHLETVTGSGRFDYVFTGHTHTPLSRQTGRTRVLNPGSPVRPRSGPPTVLLLDLENGEAVWLSV